MDRESKAREVRIGSMRAKLEQNTQKEKQMEMDMADKRGRDRLARIVEVNRIKQMKAQSDEIIGNAKKRTEEKLINYQQHLMANPLVNKQKIADFSIFAERQQSKAEATPTDFSKYMAEFKERERKV